MERLRLGMGDDTPDAENQLRANVLELMAFRRMSQAELAALLGKGQPWLSKRLSGKAWNDGGARFQIEDLDALSTVFGLSPAELLQPRYGKWDRRSGRERREIPDRRHAKPASPFQQTGPRWEDEHVS